MTILVRQAPISLVAPFVLVAASAIFWKVSRKEPSARIVFLQQRLMVGIGGTECVKGSELQTLI